MNPEIPYALEPNELIVAEYPTLHHSDPHNLPDGEEGMLVLTSKRLLFFKRHSLIRKLIKRDEPPYQLVHALYLQQIMDVDSKGVFDKCLEINGRRFYLGSADYRKISNLIKFTIQSVYNAPMSNLPPMSGPQPMYTPSSPINTPNPKGVYCTRCGKANPMDARFCMGCGSEIPRS